jgi:hypothetical protein
MIESGRTRRADVGRLAQGAAKIPRIRAKASKFGAVAAQFGSVSLKITQPEIEKEAI